MAELNVDSLQRMVAGFNARDTDVLRPLLHPNLVWYPEEDQPESGPFHGRESYLRYAEEWTEAFEDYRVELTELIGIGECVVMVARVRGSGRRSGVEVDSIAAGVFRFRDGVVVEHRECRDVEQALELARRPSFGEAPSDS